MKSTIPGLKQISSGAFHAAALTEDGKVLMWGKGSLGRLGSLCSSFCKHAYSLFPCVDRQGGKGLLYFARFYHSLAPCSTQRTAHMCPLSGGSNFLGLRCEGKGQSKGLSKQ